VPRITVLHHVFSAGSARPAHWDLLLEVDGVLQTWALAEPPGEGASQTATRLADHRLAYLDYEGPVSRDRGQVTQWTSGTYETVLRTEEVWTVDVQTPRLCGRLTLRTTGEDGVEWLLTWIQDATRPLKKSS
jgi:DNA polymerase Ligase (LigD)